MHVSEEERNVQQGAGAKTQLTEYRQDPGRPTAPQKMPSAKPADGPIQRSRTYNIGISVVIVIDAITHFWADHMIDESDGRRRLLDLVVDWDQLVAMQNIQVVLGGLLLLGGNLNFVKVYIFRAKSYWEGAGNLFEYIFSVHAFLEAIGIAVPGSIGRLSKPVTRLAQSKYCACVENCSDTPDDSMEEEDEDADADPYVWTIWGYLVIVTALFQTVISIVSEQPLRNLPHHDFLDWSTLGVVFANMQLLFAMVLVIDVAISIYESLAPDVAFYFHDAGNIFELLIATQALLANANIKVPPAIGLLVKPITKCIWRVAQARLQEGVQAEEVPAPKHVDAKDPGSACSYPRWNISDSWAAEVPDTEQYNREDSEHEFEFAV